MQEAYVNICDIPTHIMTWGKWIEESLEGVQEIVLCITGNPGLPGFYTKFLSTIHNNLDSNIPVWVIGHVGHDDPPASSIRKVPRLSGNESYFTLEAQLKHKIEFIEKYIPRNVKIHLIGHSIGAWMILQMLELPKIKEQVQKSYLLFPTIERMEESSNGWYFTRICLPIMPLLRILLIIFNILPVSIRIFLIYIYFWLFSIPNYCIGTVLKYLQLPVVERVVFLAKQEMDTVTNLQVNLVNNHKDLLKLYYGTTDGWVPVKYYNEIKTIIPDLEAELDTRKIPHAFVLGYSEEMGGTVVEWIRKYSVVSKTN